MDLDKTIKRSAEDRSGPLRRPTTPRILPGSDKYVKYLSAIDSAGLLPDDWLSVTMFDYEDRDDTLVNFYVCDPNQDTLALISGSIIIAVRVTDNNKALSAQEC